jgi:hypothetical protein
VGIAARGAASGIPDAVGDAGGRYIQKSAFADPAHAAGMKAFSSSCARQRTIQTRVSATAQETIIDTAATSAVHGIGAVAASEVK